MSVFYRLLLILIGRAIVMVGLMPLAAFVKAGTAHLLGGDTPKNSGRLSLDFRKHMDRQGMLTIMILGFGWSREMNYDVSNLKHMKRDITIISLAAPLAYFVSYIILYNLSGALYGLVPGSILLASLYRVLREAAYTGLCFGVIALLPLPPLDGFQIFYQFSWPKFRRWYFSHYKQIMKWSQYILYGIFLLAIITDGEISVIGWLADLWRRAVLDRLVFFHVNIGEIPYKIIKIVFGNNFFYLR
ncbi:site-2 protease family protein [Ruminococcus sp.]|uniref:site-2 protease family protein n=2 Tax=Ruminococcus sp. TaxID=41978 RepID=UPI002CFF27A4|nr:site-2 protease family protein [Ruminococcus sp.]HOA00637.1 site-2 protease family protein [Ruminococcus sp.]